METGRDHVRFGRVGREYVSAPPTSPEEPYEYVGAVERLAATIEAGSPSRAGGRRGAHVVAVCNAIEAAAGGGGQSSSTTAERPPTRRRRRSSDRRRPPRATRDARARRARRCRDPAPRGRIRLLALPRRRVRRPSRLDRDRARRRVPPPRSAELYGNEHRIGELLAAPGAPDRERVFLLGKAWRTNHRREHLLAACAGSREELGIDAFDCYALHWPSALEHRGELNRLAEKPVERQETLTFPEGGTASPRPPTWRSRRRGGTWRPSTSGVGPDARDL